MRIIQNPLITYKVWLVERDPEWADGISSGFFDSLRTMYETKKLSEVTKKEYEASLRAGKAYYDANRYKDSFSFKPDWAEEEYDYGDNTDFLPGLRLKRLVAFLDKFIELDIHMYSSKIALHLFQYTDYLLFRTTNGEPPLSADWRFRDKEAGESWDDYQESKLEEAALLATKASWDDFITADFNYQVISDYEKG